MTDHDTDTTAAAERRGLVQRLRDFSVRTKTLTAVGLASFVALVVGVNGINALSDATDEADALYRSNTMGIEHAAEMRTAIDGMRMAARDALIKTSRADKQGALDRLDEKYAAFEEASQAYADSGLDATTRALVEELEQAATQYDQVQTTDMATLALRGDFRRWDDLNATQVSGYTKVLEENIQAITDHELAAAADAVEAINDDYTSTRNLSIALLVGGILLATALGWWIAATLAKNVARVKHVIDGIAEGDLTRTAEVENRDEMGDMAEGLNAASEKMRGLMRTVVDSADAVAAASEQLSASSAQIAAGAEETSVQANVVSSAAEEVSRNVQTVAAGAEQMGASIREISHSANEAARVASEAVGTVEATNHQVSKLGESSQEIGNVVKVITSIAEQTNLLALNATIEAARAGEAGKGFAVVANEVKELAQETARATEDIARRVEAIQADTGGAVTAIGEIESIITSINDYQVTIASAVEEQTATTNEMSRNVADASTSSSEIATNITGVSQAAVSTTEAMNQSRQAVDELSRMAADLRGVVAQFKA
ncbi:methyl-accepting chemotaxis protein [Aeromicrobium sp. IC_218]|uniref:methyl-accepting chemotaxis protein n=1 Tax=Aeromicrobium sp. IC_218 TaxID=2545468 RepID=UPI00103A1131|nr:methyl-accepting chemotaxis protein [Aeromicrobium sp. IC_218]TCI96919.1 methyl-accepting chemotaxis protein [Aeromicrobium sp. IC_218]